MMAERQNLSQLYPGIAPDKPNHRTSIPLSCATFELQFGKFKYLTVRSDGRDKELLQEDLDGTEC